jgi:hypothetical protein
MNTTRGWFTSWDLPRQPKLCRKDQNDEKFAGTRLPKELRS